MFVAQAIASALMVNRSVKVINLEGNNMGVLGAKAAWDAEGRKCYCTAWEVRTTISGQRSKRIELWKDLRFSEGCTEKNES